MKTTVKSNIENQVYAVARINAVKFAYEITIETADKDHAKAVLNDYKKAGEFSFMMRSFPDLGLSLVEQLASKNKELENHKSRCDAINKCRTAAKKAQNLVTDWYTANRGEIKFKENGDLFAVWDKSIKEVIKKVYANTGLEISYDWEHSLVIKVKGRARLTGGGCQYFNEFVYICDMDGELSNRETQSDFKKVSPMRYLKSLDDLKALKEKRDLVDKKISDLKFYLSL